MAEEQIIISVDLQAGGIEGKLDAIVGQVASLKNEQRELNALYRAGAVDEETYIKKSKELSLQLGTLQRQQTNLTAAVQTSQKTNNDYADSLDGMRAKLNDMQRAYATLSKAQRDSSEGKEFLRAIGEQDKAVKGLEKAMGDARRNVGNYEDAILNTIPVLGNFSKWIGGLPSILDAIGKGGVSAFKGLAGGIGQATKASLAFVATPIGAMITAIVLYIGELVVAFKILTAGIRKNDEAQTALAKLMASFRPILDLFTLGLEKMAEGFALVVGAIADWIASFSEGAAAAQELVVAEDNLQEAERRYVIGAAERNKEIARLRTQAKDRERFTAEERKRFILEAIELEKQEMDEKKANAAERLRLLEENARRERDTTDEMKDKIAKARAELLNIEADYYNKTRELLEQRATAEREYNEELKARLQEQVDAYYKAYEEQQRAAEAFQQGLDAIADLEEQREKHRKDIRQKYGLTSDIERIDEELSELDEAYKKRLLTEEEYLKASKELADKYAFEEEEEFDIPSIEDIVRQKFGLDEEAIKYYNSLLESGMDANERFAAMSEWSANRAAKAFASASGSMAGAFNDMAQMLNQYGEENKKAQAASKAFALAGILASQAQSIAEGALAISAGIASAQSVPFPANIAAMATTIATITGLIVSTDTSFMQAKQLLSGADAGAFEQGGVVGGTSYTGDKLTARVNSNEVILNPKQASNVLYQMANSPIGGGFDYEAMAAAMSAQPAPVVVYKELQDFGDKIVTYNEITKI